LGKSDVSEHLSEISGLVQKIGTNRLISRKNVSFTFSEPYDFTLSLLANMRLELSINPSLHADKNWWSTKWCAIEDLNLYQPRFEVFVIAHSCLSLIYLAADNTSVPLCLQGFCCIFGQ